jgi:hypothetical protein
MLHKWAYRTAESIMADLWLANEMKAALMKPTWVPDYDTQLLFGALTAQEITGAGYTAGGIVLTGKATPYNAGADRTDLQADDVQWGPGATFQTGFAVVYDNTDASKRVWSIVDFEGTKDVDNGVFTIDWSAVGLLYLVPVTP